MKFSRGVFAVLSASGLVILLVAPAWAGGSWVQVSPRSWARQGAQIRLSGTFCEGSQAPVSAGPWFAYLDPQSAPPVLMGRVHIAPNTGNDCGWRLTATLRVPDVAPGVYWLQVCDRGCTQGVGDLVGAGEFTVVSSVSPRSQARQLRELREPLEESRAERGDTAPWLGAMLTTMALLTAGGLVTLVRRRRSRFVVPDTPAELLEQAVARR